MGSNFKERDNFFLQAEPSQQLGKSVKEKENMVIGEMVDKVFMDCSRVGGHQIRRALEWFSVIRMSDECCRLRLNVLFNSC